MYNVHTSEIATKFTRKVLDWGAGWSNFVSWIWSQPNTALAAKGEKCFLHLFIH
jgi:hypothetical protein